MRASERALWRHFPTGIFLLDAGMCGGVPRSQMTLVYGWESSGKSTLAYRTIGSAQRLEPDLHAVLIDVEGTYDNGWGEWHGIDNDKLVYVQPDTGEMALDIADEVVRGGGASIIVVDSLAALTPYKEVESSTEDDLPGLQARLIGKFVRKVVSGLSEQRKHGNHPAVICLNQYRMKIGVFHGDNRVLPGGQAPRFAAFARVEMLNKEQMGKDAFDQDTVDHNQHTFRIKKNKEGVGLRHGEFNMVRNPSNTLGQGFIDDGRAVATWAKKRDFITGSGGHYRIDGVDGEFRTLDDITAYFYSDLVFYEQFKYRLISHYRQENGLRPDGWL